MWVVTRMTFFITADRVLEDVLVDLLVDVADPRAALVVSGGVGLVDVADLERFGVQNLAVNLELLRNFLELFFLIRHSVFGFGEDGRFCGFAQSAIKRKKRKRHAEARPVKGPQSRRHSRLPAKLRP